MILTFTSIASQLLGFVYRIILSRLVGAEVLGLYQLIMPVYSVLMSLTAVGLTVATSNLSAQYHALGNFRAVGQLLRLCLTAFFLLLLPLVALVAVFSDQISVYLLGDARTQLGILLLLPCILLTGVENLHKHYFYGIGNVRPPAAIELTEQFIRAGAVLTLLIVFLPQSPERAVGLIVIGMVLCEVFSSVTLVLLYRRHMGPLHDLSGHGESPKLLGSRVRSIALPIGATALLGNLMGSANSVLIPQRLVAGGMEVSAAMSAFGVLFGMTLPMLFLPSAFIGALGLVLTPKLAESSALKRGAEIQRRIHKSLLATSVLILPAMALLVVLGPSIGLFLFHEPTAGNFLLPLSVGVVLSCYQAVLTFALNGVGRQKAAARNSLVCGGVQLAFTFFAVGQPQVGLKGYVAGFVVSSALGMFLNWIGVARCTGLRPRFFTWLVAPALASLLSGLCAGLLFRVLIDTGIAAILSAAACLVFGGILYLSALQAQGVAFFGLFRLKK
jgi:stage V sporulation protein B